MAGHIRYGAVRWLLFFTVMGLLSLSSCTGHGWILDKRRQEQNASVFLEHRVENNGIVDPGYDHPCTLVRDDLESILSALKYRRVRPFEEPVIEPVFQRQEAQNLARAIEPALSSARSWQRVRFASFNRGEGILFSIKRKTEGVIFREKKNRLNIAFVEINEESDPTVISDPELEIGRTDPLKVEQTRAPLEAQPGYMLKYEGNKDTVMPLWAVVDLSDLSAIRNRADDIESWDASADDAHTRQSHAPVEPENQEKDSYGDDPNQPGQRDADPVYEALKRIKRYFEEGLINEKEYETKKKELMDQVR